MANYRLYTIENAHSIFSLYIVLGIYTKSCKFTDISIHLDNCGTLLENAVHWLCIFYVEIFMLYQKAYVNQNKDCDYFP